MRPLHLLLSFALLLVGCSPAPAKVDAASKTNPYAGAAQAQAKAQSGFVKVEGTRFTIDGKPYRFAGANFWYGAYLGAADGIGDRARLRAELDQLKAAGIDNLRVLAMSEASAFKRAVRPAIMTAPGEYDEQMLQGLDYLLVEMGKRDMKAVL